MHFFLVTLQLGQAHALRYTLQKGPGWGAGAQAFRVEGSWVTGEAQERYIAISHCDQQLNLLLITLLSLIFILNTRRVHET